MAPTAKLNPGAPAWVPSCPIAVPSALPDDPWEISHVVTEVGAP